jgi:DNA-binding response OmpR family regulator
MSAKLLLIEDDEQYARAAAELLAAQRVDVVWIRTFAQARNLLASSPRAVFLYALIEDQLPDGYGLELLPLVESLEPKPTAVLLTAFTCEYRALAAFRAGRGLFPKPKKPAGLLDVLSALEQRRRSDLATCERSASAVKCDVFGPFALDPRGVRTPSGPMVLPPKALVLLRYLAAQPSRIVSAAELARELLGRRDRSAPAAVRRRVADGRRALGPYASLIETVAKLGYRIAPGTVWE